MLSTGDGEAELDEVLGIGFEQRGSPCTDASKMARRTRRSGSMRRDGLAGRCWSLPRGKRAQP